MMANVPAFLYGTAWKKDDTTRLVKLALASGFTAIDTANQLIHYQEALVGEAVKDVPRDTLFLQTKFTSPNGQDHRTPYDRSAPPAAQVSQSFESSLKHLYTDYLDSYVLHGPYTRRGLIDADWEVWGAMEALQRAGKTRRIGVSNVSPEQLAALCAKASIKPAFVQNRCYAVTGWDHETREICRANGIVYQGFSLLTANMDVIAAPAMRAIAERVDAGVAQVVFRFAQQVGMLPLTGTTNETHMKDDLACGRFTLAPEELQVVERIGLG
jgi:diketogulonate reductase-like aldo/keto reductase